MGSYLEQLNSALPLMIGEEQKEALALLEADRQARFVSEMADTVLDALLAVGGALELARGAEPAPIHPHPSEQYTLLDDRGNVRPYEDWRDRQTGDPLTDRDRAGLGPLTRWNPRSEVVVDPYADETLNLLAPAIRDRVRQALASGSWSASPMRPRMLEDLDP